jgi:hypothetical protein
MFLGVVVSTLFQVNLRNANASSGAAGLHAAHGIQKLVSIYQKALNFLSKAQDIYDTITDVLDLLSLDVKDLVELRNSLASGSGGFLAGHAPNRLVSMEVPIPDNILNSFKRVRSIVKNVLSGNALQEFLAEMATSVITYTLGFEQTNLSWHKKHGPDQVARHSTGVWGIFEAKGGTSKLSHSVTSKGRQMQEGWISNWLEEIIERNRRTEAGKELKVAYDSRSPMLAAVTRLSMEDLPGDRVGVELHIGVQKYQRGATMEKWKGF